MLETSTWDSVLLGCSIAIPYRDFSSTFYIDLYCEEKGFTYVPSKKFVALGGLDGDGAVGCLWWCCTRSTGCVY